VAASVAVGLGPAGAPADVDPVLERDLERPLDRHRAVGGEGEVGLLDRDHPGQRLGQLDDDRVAVAEHRRVRHPGGLGGEGRIELGDPVPQGVDPSNEMASR